MLKKTINGKSLAFALAYLAIGLSTIFLFPREAFFVSSHRNSDLTFGGLALLFGEIGARYFVSLPFFIMCFRSFKDAFSVKKISEKTVFPSRLRGRRSRVVKGKEQA
jgi:hypothetical protein